MKKLLSIFLMAFSLNAFAQTNLADVQLKDLNNQPVTLRQTCVCKNVGILVSDLLGWIS